MKLKTNKTIIKRLRMKIKNQNNKDLIEKKNIWQIVLERLNWKQTKLLWKGQEKKY